MHDLRFIRENPDLFDRGLARRGLPAAATEILELDARRRVAQTSLQELQARRNEASKQIGLLKRDGGETEALMAEVEGLKAGMLALEDKERSIGTQLEDILAALPNLPAADVPDGPDETANVELRRHGVPSRQNDTPDHVAIGEALGMMDFATAAKLSGARFTVLRAGLARLERALGQFMLDTHTQEYGYTETSAPLLVKNEAVFGTGQLPKFADDLFRTTTGLWLVPTAEVSLTNSVADMILDADELPLRLTALTPCFRSEAGAAGRDTRGMVRQHQFWKVELVSITAPDQSNAEHERMTEAAQSILQRLGLTYRTILLCSGDMGFCSRKTYDIEVWLPAQNTYREISSCSNCGDFQARRMKARFKAKGGKDTAFVHTLNGSGLAVGRALVAVLENYRQADGSVAIPEVLWPYMGGLRELRAA